MADTILGGAGNNVLRGGKGADALHGGSNSDTFRFAQGDLAGGDLARGEVVDGGAGLDTLYLDHANTYDFRPVTLARIEIVAFSAIAALTAGAATFAGGQIGGTTGARTIVGNTLVDKLTVIGAQVDLSTLTFTNWTAGVDRLTIKGTGGADVLTGSATTDRISGLGGADVLTGGLGADLFIWTDGLQSAVGQSDTVTDFAHGIDKIDLSGFAVTQVFIGGAAFTGAGAQVRYAAGVLEGDLDGNTVADWSVTLTGAFGLTAGDLIL